MNMVSHGAAVIDDASNSGNISTPDTDRGRKRRKLWTDTQNEKEQHRQEHLAGEEGERRRKIEEEEEEKGEGKRRRENGVSFLDPRGSYIDGEIKQSEPKRERPKLLILDEIDGALGHDGGSALDCLLEVITAGVAGDNQR